MSQVSQKLANQPPKPALGQVPRLDNPVMGCDPELFIETSDGVVGSETIIPKEGIYTAWGNKIVRDGVQIELQPPPATCRQTLGATLAGIIQQLDAELVKHASKGIKASFAPVVEVPKEEFDKLSAEAKRLGCAPSSNALQPRATVKVSKADERIRSAGGHIHMGIGHHHILKSGNPKNQALRDQLVNLLDVMVGLPCVLIDRDPNQAKRRKVYGRAGEYRLPPHGIEYRTPSNFWLRHFVLMHFVLGQARTAFFIWRVSLPNSGWGSGDFASDLLAQVNMADVEKAINRNDFDLAMKCWRPVAEWIEQHIASGFNSGLEAGLTKPFEFFVTEIRDKGIERWFPDSPMDHWCHRRENPPSYRPGGRGIESFLNGVVAAEMRKVSDAAALKAAKRVA